MRSGFIMSGGRLAVTALLAALFLFAAAPVRAHECADGAQAWRMIQIYFGRNVEGRAPVSDAEWSDFVENVLSKRFADGYTILDAMGGWQPEGAARPIREQSKVAMIAAPDGDKTRAAIKAVVTAYKKAFRQQSVGIVTHDVCARF